MIPERTGLPYTLPSTQPYQALLAALAASERTGLERLLKTLLAFPDETADEESRPQRCNSATVIVKTTG